ncbi:MarR family winged helix-turn-helix transcriptional regulator [Pigmentiphaga sp.]|uniref:MarR family winged helix-turn-helix transcriptional regulator n=1 Tax=Pigmentiphaga sp. TaxID=1977564 RepID=UPI00128E2631|nr:MarR family winged helix-turn-helix transcriptional regulator [Pigmentiphaga sp.]MPS28156.1 MarR family transcriptional regulator [Alcaligenaceae bacterium SAGV5]MPS51354.1 MarR family transcriptional regulator [Alcaligenaceae bacterium SAGV3]MPT55922.1 MarR family transcriptional regulator [Alcaligenaceae bacterium]
MIHDEADPNDHDTSSPPFDPAEQVLWSRSGYLVRRLNQIHYAMFFEECSHEITPVQYGILTALSLQPGSDQKTIGHELGLDRTTTADVVKRLERKGYLTRRVDPEDRRSRQSFITEEGLRVMGQLQAGMTRAQQRLISPLSKKDQDTFMRLLSKLVQANNHYGRAAADL